ncbi:putative phage tail protein [Levilactobacillus fujinensis]|nr:putative phage tail protein [Levilactobacillus fujinensis]
MSKLVDYLPDYYDKVVEMQKLMVGEQPVFDAVSEQADRILLNEFVMATDVDGLSMFENQFGMVASPTATVESRRYDILVRMLPPRPITIWYFKELVASFAIPAMVVVDSVKSRIDTLSEAHVITAEQVERLKYLLNVYTPSNLEQHIRTSYDVENRLPVYFGQAASICINSAVMPQAVNFS